jgi:hypothetical protein
MAGNDPRIEEILLALELIKKKLPNGELEVIKQSIQSLSEDQKIIKEDLEYFKKRLFNPDDGVIVRINKNSDSISRYEDTIDEVPEIKNKVDNLEQWKDGVSRALWIVYTSLVGIIISLIFAAINK